MIQLSTELLLALLIDSCGCLALRKRRLTALRVMGVLVSVVGSVLTVSDFLDGTGSDPASQAISEPEPSHPQSQQGASRPEGRLLAAYLVLVVVVGCCRPLQTVVNGGLKAAVQSPVRAATVSIAVTVLTLLALSNTLHNVTTSCSMCCSCLSLIAYTIGIL